MLSSLSTKPLSPLSRFFQPSFARVRLDSEHPYRTSIPELEPLLGDGACRFPLLQVLRFEIRSLLGRIREARCTGLYRRGIVFPPESLMTVVGTECATALQSYSDDKQKICRYRPWMSLSDTLTFQLGWLKGAEFAYRILHVVYLNNRHYKLSLTGVERLATKSRMLRQPPSPGSLPNRMRAGRMKL